MSKNKWTSMIMGTSRNQEFEDTAEVTSVEDTKRNTVENEEKNTQEGRVQRMRNRNFLGEDRELDLELRSDVFTNKSEYVRICKPTSYDQVDDIADAIIAKKVVILNMNQMNNEQEAVRIVEFIYGVCKALKVIPETVEPNIYSIDPNFKRNA